MTERWENAIALALIIFIISGIVVFLPSWLKELAKFLEKKGERRTNNV